MTVRAVVRIAPGLFSVQVGDRQEIVYAVGPPSDRWAFWNGQVFHVTDEAADSGERATSAGFGQQTLTAPMPARVVKVLVTPGAQVTKGDTVVLLEAMKMELPVRALADGMVKAVQCHEGELVGAGQELVTF